MGTKIVNRLDHVIIRAQQAGPLFSILTQQLLLPEAWPVSTNAFFTSGGVSLGSANLEIIQVGRQKTPARPYGVAFELEPYPQSLPALEVAGIPHTPPLPFYQFDEQGWQTIAWSNVYLGGLLNWTLVKRIFFALSHRLSSDAWERRALPTAVNRRFGMPLLFDWVYRNGMITGVEYNPAWRSANIRPHAPDPGLEVRGVHEITIGSSNYSRVYRRWKSLLEGHREVVEAVWRLPDEMHIRLTPAPRDGLVGMIWLVESLNRAAQFLYKRQMLGAEKDKTVTIKPETILGLDIRIMQA